MKQTVLGRQIASLLRPHRRGPLGPAEPYGPMPGGRAMVDAMERGMPPIAAEIALLMEHGWRVLSPAGVGTVYCDASTAAYYAGLGTALPGGGAAHVVGPLAVAPPSYVPTWPDGPPVLGSHAEHASLVCTAAAPCDWSAERPAHEYSGLARAVVQALHGAGRLAASIGLTSTSHGVVRAPNGQYWVVSAGASLVARRLEVPPELAALATWAAAGGHPAADRRRLDAYVWGALRQPETVDEAALGSLAAANSLGAGVTRALLAGREWAWRHQSRGASDEHIAGAVVCPVGYNWNLSTSLFGTFSKRVVMVIEWGEDHRPVGFSLEQTPVKKWRGNGKTYWLAGRAPGDAYGMCLTGNMPSSTSIISEFAYWDAWYNSVGELVDCTIHTRSSSNFQTGIWYTADGPWPLCPGETRSETMHSVGSYTEEIVAIGDAVTTAMASGSVSIKTWKTQLSEMKEVWDIKIENSDWVDTCAGQPFVIDYNAPFIKYGADVTQTITESSTSVLDSKRYIILPKDREAAWLVQSYTAPCWEGGYSAGWGPVFSGYWQNGNVYVRKWFRPIRMDNPTLAPVYPDEFLNVRAWYVDSEGSAHRLSLQEAETWLVNVTSRIANTDCYPGNPYSAQSAGGRLLAAGVDDGDLSAVGAASLGGRWVGGV